MARCDKHNWILDKEDCIDCKQENKYDCYKKAEKDEPTFTLLGRDRAAAETIRKWVFTRIRMGETNVEKMIEALEAANRMEVYATAMGRKI